MDCCTELASLCSTVVRFCLFCGQVNGYQEPFSGDAEPQPARLGLERTALLPQGSDGARASASRAATPPRPTDVGDVKSVRWAPYTEESVTPKKPQSSKDKQRNASGLSLASEDEEVCSTCLEGYSEENPAIRTKCNHHFHLACIYEWLERKETCPVCGRKMAFDELEIGD